MAAKDTVSLNFDLVGDQFPHAWFYNKFRVENFGDGILCTFLLVSESSGILATNAVMLSEVDLRNNKQRVLGYLQSVNAPNGKDFSVSYSSAPSRVYPVNNVSLARVGPMAEIGFYRFSVNTLVDGMNAAKTAKNVAKLEPVKCYPIVVFRSDLDVQVAFLKELYASQE